MSSNRSLWVEKYRPNTITDYVFHDSQHKAAFQQMIATKSIPQLLFSGVQGSGKTCIARILISAMDIDDIDVLTINASDNRGIDTFRESVKSFAETMSMSEFKIIHLEESDRLTIDAQSALKGFMEDVSDNVRFIFTCNHVSKILPPIRSRCQEYFFKASDYNDIAEYCIKILASECVKFDLDTLDTYLNFGYPDIRKIVNLIQQNTIAGVLQSQKLDNESGDYQFKLIDMIENDQWNNARKLVCSTVNSDGWEGVYRFLYENLSHSKKFQDPAKWEEAILVVADSLYKNSISADPEINMASCLIQLNQI
jgi:DNA polymerase III delta prime subunit